MGKLASRSCEKFTAPSFAVVAVLVPDLQKESCAANDEFALGGGYVTSDPIGVLGLAVLNGNVSGLEEFYANWFSLNPRPGDTISDPYVTANLPRLPNEDFDFDNALPYVSLNTYAYANNGPLRWTDFLGLTPKDNWHGFNDPAFRDWVHQWKQDAGLPGGFQFDKKELQNLHQCWEEDGKPRGKGGKSGKGGRSKGGPGRFMPRGGRGWD
jgi:hypothetical protein